MRNLLIALFVLVALALGWWLGSRQAATPPPQEAEHQEHGEHSEHEEEGEHEEHEEHPEGVVEMTPEQIKGAGIVIETIQSKATRDSFQATGTLTADPDREVHVTAQIPGRLLDVNVKEGQSVVAGQELLTLDSPELARTRAEYQRALVEVELTSRELDRRTRLARVGDETRRQLEEARVEVVTAESALASARARQDVARRKLTRTEDLLKDGIASTQQAEEARGALREAQADVRQAQSELTGARSHLERESSIQKQGLVANREVAEAQAAAARAQADVRQARETVLAMGASPDGQGASFTINAPLSGIVTGREATRGEAVEVGDRLLTLLNAERLWLLISVPENQAAALRAARNAEIRVGGRTFQGRITYVAPELDPETRSLKARAELDNRQGHLRPNTFAQVTVLGPSSGQAPAVPPEAVQTVEGQEVVYVVEEPGHFVRTPLKQVKAGAKVVTRGAFSVKSEDQRETMGEGHSH